MVKKRKEVTATHSRKIRSRRKGKKLLRDGNGEEERKTITYDVEKYIDNVILHEYVEAYKKTFFAFRMYERKKKRNTEGEIEYEDEAKTKPKTIDPIVNKKNSTFLFINELFRYDWNDVEYYYINKQTIIGFIIILGLFDEFDLFITEIMSKYDDVCNDKKVKNFEEKGKSFFTDILQKKVDDETLMEKYHKYFDQRKTVEEIKNHFQNKISQFFHTYFCDMDTYTIQCLLRDYFLMFLNSSQRYLFDLKIKDTFIHADSEILINNFFVKVSKFEPLHYRPITWKNKTTGEIKNFNTCGETTVLNVINYLLMNKEGSFDLRRLKKLQGKENDVIDMEDVLLEESENETKEVEMTDVTPKNKLDEMIQFYKKYNSIEKQIKNQEEVLLAWCDIVSNLEKKEIYNVIGDIHNNIHNIIYVFQTILNVKEKTLPDIFEKVNPEIYIQVTKTSDVDIEFIMGDLVVFFRPGHGEMKNDGFDVTVSNEKKQSYQFKNDDFAMLYNKIFSKINYRGDFFRQQSLLITDYVVIDQKSKNECNKTNELEEELKLLREETKNLSAQRHAFSSQEFHQKMKQLNETKKKCELKLKNETKFTSFNDYFKFLTSLIFDEDLKYEKEFKEIPEKIFEMTNLKHLQITGQRLGKIPEKLNQLQKLETLNLFYNDIYDFSDQIKLPNLYSLNLEQNLLSSFPFENFPTLEILTLGGNFVKDYSKLQTLKELTSLQLYNGIPRDPKKLKKEFPDVFIPEAEWHPMGEHIGYYTYGKDFLDIEATPLYIKDLPKLESININYFDNVFFENLPAVTGLELGMIQNVTISNLPNLYLVKPRENDNIYETITISNIENEQFNLRISNITVNTSMTLSNIKMKNLQIENTNLEKTQDSNAILNIKNVNIAQTLHFHNLCYFQINTSNFNCFTFEIYGCQLLAQIPIVFTDTILSTLDIYSCFFSDNKNADLQIQNIKKIKTIDIKYNTNLAKLTIQSRLHSLMRINVENNPDLIYVENLSLYSGIDYFNFEDNKINEEPPQKKQKIRLGDGNRTGNRTSTLWRRSQKKIKSKSKKQISRKKSLSKIRKRSKRKIDGKKSGRKSERKKVRKSKKQSRKKIGSVRKFVRKN